MDKRRMPGKCVPEKKDTFHIPNLPSFGAIRKCTRKEETTLLEV